MRATTFVGMQQQHEFNMRSILTYGNNYCFCLCKQIRTQRDKIQPTCLLSEHGIKAKNTGSGILKNDASKLAENTLYSNRTARLTLTGLVTHHRFAPLQTTPHNIGYPSVSWLFVFSPSITDLMYSVTQTIWTCVQATRHVLAGVRFTAGQSIFLPGVLTVFYNITPPVHLPGKFDKF